MEEALHAAQGDAPKTKTACINKACGKQQVDLLQSTCYLSAMLYTQAQLRHAIGVGTEVIRHWKGVVPLLAAKSGPSPQFTFADLLCLAIMRDLTERLGISIGRLGPASESLFKLCNCSPAHGLERGYITFNGEAFTFRNDNQQSIFAETIASVAVGPILIKLREDLLASQVLDAQAVFLFRHRR
ncbi:hypothetical protein [Rhizobium sp. AN69]|uniref:hypothetical protein n=1 Tax=Rhizobium sp. AN69 TaxID=3035213 RepID=UPI002B264684|nr:hypothetical protein [Rhizobium sp. AN69]